MLRLGALSNPHHPHIAEMCNARLINIGCSAHIPQSSRAFQQQQFVYRSKVQVHHSRIRLHGDYFSHQTICNSVHLIQLLIYSLLK